MIYKEGSKDISRLCFIIKRLPIQHREILLLCLEGEDIYFISQKLAISEKIVEYRKKRACNYLRKHLYQREDIAFALWFYHE